MRRGLTAMAKGRSFKERLEILVDRELRSANTGTPSRVLAEAIKLALVDNGYNRDADMRVLALWAKTAQDAPEQRPPKPGLFRKQVVALAKRKLRWGLSGTPDYDFAECIKIALDFDDRWGGAIYPRGDSRYVDLLTIASREKEVQDSLSRHPLEPGETEWTRRFILGNW